MGFWDDEKSLTSSVPVELHQFQVRDTSTYWRYADSPADVVYAGNTYTASDISGDRIEAGTTLLKARTLVTVDWSNPFAAQYMDCEPDGIVDYSRYRLQGANAVRVFVGAVCDVIFLQDDRTGTNRRVEIAIDPIGNDLRTAGLVLRYGRQCQVELYSSLCGVARASYALSGVIATITSLTTLTSTAFSAKASGWLEGGEIVANSRRRKIVSHSGDTIVIARRIPGLAVGQGFTAYAGCDHYYTTCYTKFDNLNNCRSQPFLPDTDPWSAWGFA